MVIANKRGEISYVQLAISLLIAILVGGIIYGGVITMVNTQIAPQLGERFEKTESEAPAYDEIQHQASELVSEQDIFSDGATYFLYLGDSNYHELSYGTEIPETPTVGDKVEYGIYMYLWNAYQTSAGAVFPDKTIGGWNMQVKNAEKGRISFEPGLSTIKNRTVCGMEYCYSGCTAMTTAPEIPSQIHAMEGAYIGCTALVSTPRIPNCITSLTRTFLGCTSLIQITSLPQDLQNSNETFENCTSLAAAPQLPSGIKNISRAFYGCTSLISSPDLPEGIQSIDYAFFDCVALSSMPYIPDSVITDYNAFGGCISLP